MDVDLQNVTQVFESQPVKEDEEMKEFPHSKGVEDSVNDYVSFGEENKT